MNYTKQQLEKITDDPKHPDDQNLHEATVENIEKNMEASLFIRSHNLLNVKQQACTSLHLPGITQKVVKNVPTLKPLFQQKETETDWKCSDIEGTNIAKTVPASSITSFQNQTPFRLLAYQKKLNSKQWFENEAPELEKNTDWTGREGKNKSKDSTYVSQDGLGKGCINSTGHPSTERQESAENFPSTPEPSRVSNNIPRVETPFDLLQPESEGSTYKSPGFSFLTSFTTKSPGFNFFDSSTFETEISPDHQTGESCSAGHINPTSPCKNIGDLFGKMDNEDAFAFSFPSCSSAQAFQDGKDDFSFPFVFESSESSSLKGFQSSSQSKKPFSFF
ncbi:hypothetical protein JD844_020466 [Phrynosoma platyrhinos]|uniref:Protein SIX6OS1 n=1 Tax=Phrynosoma platyrhinos TaxID=52577 RepID=A0ABQ7SSF2_PHRPL|nr:hypothetical protein JD844_020466 [Phrynosoma platyrhinos]